MVYSTGFPTLISISTPSLPTSPSAGFGCTIFERSNSSESANSSCSVSESSGGAEQNIFQMQITKVNRTSRTAIKIIKIEFLVNVPLSVATAVRSKPLGQSLYSQLRLFSLRTTVPSSQIRQSSGQSAASVSTSSSVASFFVLGNGVGRGLGGLDLFFGNGVGGGLGGLDLFFGNGVGRGLGGLDLFFGNGVGGGLLDFFFGNGVGRGLLDLFFGNGVGGGLLDFFLRIGP